MARPHPAHIITDDSAIGGSVIERSLRFNRGDAAYLQTTLGNSNVDKWTWSGWVKKTVNGEHQNLFSSGSDSVVTMINFDNSDYLKFQNWHSGQRGTKITNRKFRDPSAWYHIVAIWDSGNSTADDRIRLYVNGTRETSFSSSSNPDQNQDSVINGNTLGGSDYGEGKHFIGRYADLTDPSGTYKAEINFVDGYAYDPSYFGFTDSLTGIWMPKRYEGVYGSNGFYLDFSDNTSTTTLGIDKSPNGNDFTLNNFAVSDSVPDTSSSNFCTWNASAQNFMASGSVTFTEGNLKIVDSSGGYGTMAKGTFEMESGKWYWEVLASSINSYSSVGLTNKDGKSWGDGVGMYYFSSANKNSTTTSSGYSSYGASYSDGDIIGVAFDADNESVTFYKNNSSQGAIGSVLTQANGGYFPAAGDDSSSNTTTFVANFGQDSSFVGAKTAQGNTDGNGIGDFYYTPPTGYKALCSRNLPLTPPSFVRPQRFFDTILFTGDGSSSKEVTGLEFKPDLVWMKGRASMNHYIVDSVRGRASALFPNSDSAEQTSSSSQDLVEFNDHGFVVGTPYRASSSNDDGTNIVAWCWKAGGAAVANTDGTLNSQVSVNEEAGFSIASWTSTGTTGSTIGHGLGKKPDWIILKGRNTSESQPWRVYHKSLGATGGIMLDSTSAFSAQTGVWNDTEPTSSVFTVGSFSSTNENTKNYIAYCWYAIPGFSKFGSYTGNGSSDGPYIHLGFRPAWTMIKSSSATWNWVMQDTERFGGINSDANDKNLAANSSSAEPSSASFSGNQIDYLSNGFKLRSTAANTNASGGTYIYMAFAEQPGTTPFDTFPNAR